MISRRGLFGVVAGAAVAPLEEAADADAIPTFSKGEYRLCKLNAYYPHRNMGFMEDAENGRKIFFRRDTVQRAGIDRLELMRTYWVASDKKGRATCIEPAGRREPRDVIAELDRRGWHVAS